MHLLLHLLLLLLHLLPHLLLLLLPGLGVAHELIVLGSRGLTLGSTPMIGAHELIVLASRGARPVALLGNQSIVGIIFRVKVSRFVEISIRVAATTSIARIPATATAATATAVTVTATAATATAVTAPPIGACL